MKKADKLKMDEYLGRLAKTYVWCFNPSEVSNKYLDRFVHNRWDSALYNNEIGKLKLDCLGGDVSDVTEGIEDEKVAKDIEEYFIRGLKKALKNEFPIREAEIKAQKEKERAEKDKAKGKKKKK